MHPSAKEKFQNQLNGFLPTEAHPSYAIWKEYHLNAEKRGYEIVELLDSIGLNLKGKLVLDAGCGTCGPYVAFERSGSEVVGVDVSRDSLQVGKTRISAEGFVVNLVVASTQHLPFRDNLFDIVFFADVIEHTQKPSECAKEIYYVLADGGLLYASGPNIFSTVNFLHDPHYKLPFISILPPSVGKDIAKKTKRGDEEIKMFTMWGFAKLFSNQGFQMFIVDDSQTRKKLSDPSLVQSKIRYILLLISKRTRTDRVVLSLMRVFHNSIHQFLCVKNTIAMKDIETQNVIQ